MAIATLEQRSSRVRANEAAGKLSSEGRRKGEIKSPRDISRSANGVWQPVLYHQSYGRIGAHISDKGLGGNRRQAGQGLQPECGEAEILEADQLFRSDGGDRRAGAAIDPRGATGRSADQERRGCPGGLGLSRS